MEKMDGRGLEVFEKVRDIVAEQLLVDKTEIKLTTSFAQDLNADSLDMVEVVLDLEEEFGIKVPDKDAENITTVREAVAYINEHR